MSVTAWEVAFRSQLDRKTTGTSLDGISTINSPLLRDSNSEHLSAVEELIFVLSEAVTNQDTTNIDELSDTLNKLLALENEVN